MATDQGVGSSNLLCRIYVRPFDGIRRSLFFAMNHADTSQASLAQCRGVRRIHLRLKVSACERAPSVHIKLICAWLIATRKKRSNPIWIASHINWATRIRTLRCWSQSPVPYHLAIAHHSQDHIIIEA